MKRFVVGVDSARRHDPVLLWAANLAGPLRAELIARAAWMPAQSELPPEEATREFCDVGSALHASIAALPRSDWGYREEVIPGAPVDVILESGDAEDADLLVVGLRGGAGTPLRSHSIGEKTAHRATRPLALVPETSTNPPRRIVLGVDGSEGANAAVVWCAHVAAALGAEVIATAVYTQQIELIPEDDPSSVYQYFTRDLNGAWTAKLREHGVAVTTRLVREVRASSALLKTAAETNADAIVVGMRRRAPLEHIRLGGNAMRLLHATPVPLVLVPPA